VRNRFQTLRPILWYLGAILEVSGFTLLAPAAVRLVEAAAGQAEVRPGCFLGPAVLTWGAGRLLKKTGDDAAPMDDRGAFLTCALAWLAVSLAGAIPLWISGVMPFLDAYFETVSGYTTTGITMLTGLERLPRSLLFWRAFMQWVGGLGILALFLAVGRNASGIHRLFGAESHKISSARPTPCLIRTLHALWFIYTGLTLLTAVLLAAAGAPVFDAVVHAFTALSTGGYSPYDASIAHYREAGYVHYRAIEWILIAAMAAGGTNFVVHYRLLSGRVRALWDSLEMRIWWGILFGSVALVLISRWCAFHAVPDADAVRDAFFQVTAIATTTGFGTRDIGSTYYPAAAQQLFLVLMVVGGCVGSTGGGIKVLRIGILWKMMLRQVRRVTLGPRAVVALTVDGAPVPVKELRRIAALFFAWCFLLAAGGIITALFSDLGPLQAASGMFSALGNIGPCYIPVTRNAALHPLIKVTWIFGMLAGRLEIIPVLLLFNRRAWR